MDKMITGGSKLIKVASILGLVFAGYNVVLFAIAGFADHGAPFWISYVFMLIAFGCLAAAGALLNHRHYIPRDWLFGYPIIKHSTIYIAVELIVSTIFMLLDATGMTGVAPFVIQFLILAVHLVFLISCFLAKEIIQDVETKVKDATTYIRLLQVDVEMVASKATDPAVKEAFTKLAEDVRFSDPMSNPNLFELEKLITQQVTNADSCIVLNDNDGALQCCNRASMLLQERNKKCKALK